MLRRVAPYGATIVVTLGLLTVVGCMFQERLIFPSHFAGTPTGATPASVERWWLPHSATEAPTEGEPDAKTEVWWALGDGRTAESPGPAVLYFHGNGEILEEIDVRKRKMYTRRGVSIALMEYRGYGNADGKPGQRRIVADAKLLLERVLVRPEVDEARVVYHGRSLGGGVAAQLAKHRAPAGLILETTFTSVVAMARRYFAPASWVRHPFRTDQVISDHYDGPILVFHGDADGIIPVSHGRALAQIAPDRTTYIETVGDGHNDFPRDFAAFEAAVDVWMHAVGIVGDEPSRSRESVAADDAEAEESAGSSSADDKDASTG
jgi:hypothetical protein